MDVIFPIAVTEDTLTYSNVVENDYAPWASGTAYVRGDYAISTTTHTIYRALVDSTGEDPDIESVNFSDPLIQDPDTRYWQIMGATNRWKLFDSKPSQPCVQANSVEVELRPGVFISGIAGFELSAESVRVQVYADDILIYDRTAQLRDESGVVGWLTYFTAPYLPATEFVFTDLPVLGTPRIVVTFEGTECHVGQLVIGQLIRIGETSQEGTGFSGLDFSYVQNDDFGNLTTVNRPAVKLSEYTIAAQTQTLQATYEKLRSLRGGRPAVWVGDQQTAIGAVNYGFMRNYDVVYQTRDLSELSIEVQGII